MKRYLLISFLLISFAAFSQNTINNYKYIIVPARYDFVKQNDQYSLNTITKGLLELKGFTVYFDGPALPDDLANNKCNALTADVKEKSGVFVTTMTLLLKDCHGNVVFKSKDGKSREKENRISYNQALRDAFKSLDEVSYTYTGAPAEPAQPTAAAPVVSTPVNISKTIIDKPTETLYAQPIANGYQLVDTAPKVILTLLKTSAADYFIASNTMANGVVLKKGGDWFFEYYKNGMLVSEKLLVKF